MKGVCLHQNMGAVGTALAEDIWHKRLIQLKKMGCNAIRTSHYPYAPDFLCHVRHTWFYGDRRTVGRLVPLVWLSSKVPYDYSNDFLD